MLIRREWAKRIPAKANNKEDEFMTLSDSSLHVLAIINQGYFSTLNQDLCSGTSVLALYSGTSVYCIVVRAIAHGA